RHRGPHCGERRLCGRPQLLRPLRPDRGPRYRSAGGGDHRGGQILKRGRAAAGADWPALGPTPRPRPGEETPMTRHYSIQVVDRALHMLDLIASGSGLSFDNLVEATGLSKSTARRLLRVLVDIGV